MTKWIEQYINLIAVIHYRSYSLSEGAILRDDFELPDYMTRCGNFQIKLNNIGSNQK